MIVGQKTYGAGGLEVMFKPGHEKICIYIKAKHFCGPNRNITDIKISVLKGDFNT